MERLQIVSEVTAYKPSRQSLIRQIIYEEEAEFVKSPLRHSFWYECRAHGGQAASLSFKLYHSSGWSLELLAGWKHTAAHGQVCLLFSFLFSFTLKYWLIFCLWEFGRGTDRAKQEHVKVRSSRSTVRWRHFRKEVNYELSVSQMFTSLTVWRNLPGLLLSFDSVLRGNESILLWSHDVFKCIFFNKMSLQILDGWSGNLVHIFTVSRCWIIVTLLTNIAK